MKEIQSTIKAMIEEFVELHNRLSPEMDRYETLKKKLGKLANADKTDGPITLEGYQHVIDYSTIYESLVCNVNPEQFIDITGAWGALTVSVTESKKILKPYEMEGLFDKKPGSRRFKRIR